MKMKMHCVIVSESATSFRKTTELIREYLEQRWSEVTITAIQPNQLSELDPADPLDLVVLDLEPGSDHSRLVRIAKKSGAEVLCFFYFKKASGVVQAVKGAGALGCLNPDSYLAHNPPTVRSFLESCLAEFQPTFA